MYNDQTSVSRALQSRGRTLRCTCGRPVACVFLMTVRRPMFMAQLQRPVLHPMLQHFTSMAASSCAGCSRACMSGRWCRNSAKAMAESEWKDCTALNACTRSQMTFRQLRICCITDLQESQHCFKTSCDLHMLSRTDQGVSLENAPLLRMMPVFPASPHWTMMPALRAAVS